MLPPSIVRSEEACHVETLVGDGERSACPICAGICRGPGDSWLLEVGGKEADAAACPPRLLARGRGPRCWRVDDGPGRASIRGPARRGTVELVDDQVVEAAPWVPASRRHPRTTDGSTHRPRGADGPSLPTLSGLRKRSRRRHGPLLRVCGPTVSVGTLGDRGSWPRRPRSPRCDRVHRAGVRREGAVFSPSGSLGTAFAPSLAADGGFDESGA